MSFWTPVKERDKLGVTFHNFLIEGENHLQAYIGDMIHIFEECEGWYFGCLVRNSGLRGIIPKNYIKIKDPDETKQAGAVVQEATAMLREWGRMLRDIYVRRDTKVFKSVQNFADIISDEIGFRASLVRGKLPAEEARDLRTKLTTQMDVVNHLLQLDLVVRDKEGNILDPERVSAIQLYRQHRLSAENRTRRPAALANKSNSYMLLLSVKNFTWKRSEDMELFISVYVTGVGDHKAPKPLCENYVLKWTRQGMAKDLDQLNNFKVVFTDLSKEDVRSSENRVWLVCNVIGDGNYQALASDFQINKSFSRSDITTRSGLSFRKPLGVAAMEITDYFNQTNKNIDGGQDKEFNIPFLPSGSDAETLETTFRKLTSEKRESSKTQGPGLWVSYKVLQGDMTSMQEGSKSHLVVGRPCIARKIGFPDLILPNDVRNDLYVNVFSADLSRLNKTADRNVEVVIEAVDETGVVMDSAISGGASLDLSREFSTVVYYHDGKPRWNEVVRVVVPVELYHQAHLRFTLKHRSRGEAKEKHCPAPWALAYLKLVNESNGTTISDGPHDLLVYKIEKKFDMSNPTYLDLPSLKTNQTSHKHKLVQYNNALSLITRDVLIVQTTLCSTKLTQNLGLLSLLKWRSEPERLKHNLAVFTREVKAAEVVKFLPDVLDALFSILMENSDSELYDNLVFEALVAVIGMVTEDRYKQFIPVLEVYINENYSATLAYNKLLVVFKDYVESATGDGSGTVEIRKKTDKLSSAMNSLQFLFKFVVKSRLLFSALNGGKGAEPFEAMLRDVLVSLIKLMFGKHQEILLIQSSCLKQLVLAVPDLVQVFPRRLLAEIFMKMINSIPPGQLTENKLQTLQDLVHSELFKFPDCRQVILPVLANRIDKVITEPTLIAMATSSLGDCLDCLFQTEKFHTNYDDVTTVMAQSADYSLLRTVIQGVANRSPSDKNAPALVTNMILLFKLMTPNHFSAYIHQFDPESEAGRQNLLDFVMEVLLMFKDLIKHSIYPNDWAEMTMLMNSVILTALRQLSHTIRDYFGATISFEVQLWNNFFECAISFLTQPSLQLEQFSQMKRAKILARYRDMRKDMGLEIKSMWFNLGGHKIRFVPGMVGSFLEMTLIPDIDLRSATIPIFFDMMQCEFYSNRLSGSRSSLSSVSSLDSRQEGNANKGNFREFETEMISQLDNMMMEGGKGDQMYKDKFRQILMEQCEQHMALKEPGTRFVRTVTRLMELLLEYRSICQEESKDNKMSCIVNLLDFYSENRREEMFVRHLKKLYDLHMECENWAEAGFTLEKQANMLRWTDEPLNSRLRHSKYPECRLHRDLKVCLYKEMISLFDKGQMWEHALEQSRHLARQYEDEIVDYYAMADLRKQEAEFYEDIMTRLRPEPEYFRVAFYGRSFPKFLQNKVFVYRGRGFERLPEFQSRILDQFPMAELMTKLSAPSEAEMNQPGQLIQINKVEPIMETPARLSGKAVHQQILNYYKVNEVSQFMYSRPFRRQASGRLENNEFASLWLERTILRTSYQLPGILRWFPVIHTEVYELSPLQTAIETMQKANKDLRNLIQEHMGNSPVPLNPLSMKLNGIIDAAVMGGTAMYEKAFFSDEFRGENPDKREQLVILENLMADQIPLLAVGIDIHDRKKSDDLAPFHDRLSTMFLQMKDHVEAKYGARSIGPEFQMNQHRKTLSRGSGSAWGNGGGGTSPLIRNSVETPSTRISSVESRVSDGDSTPVTKSRSNLMAKIGVNRKRSRASEERHSARPPTIRGSIPEHVDSSHYSSLGRNSRVSLPITETYRGSSPAHSNRDSLISGGSAGSDTSAPPVPPKNKLDYSGNAGYSGNSGYGGNAGGHSPSHQPHRHDSFLEEQPMSAIEEVVSDMRFPVHSPRAKGHTPLPSSKKKPAPPPPTVTPPTPPKKAPLKLPIEKV